ncbi:hypothetical protein [Pseudoalteromonas phage H105/1]|uniref:hypothetical protein n=1 Tax=Pseudoalteromonas phage H105/1 TaxID=877240 RepID=UPI0001E439D1|nr:hypothetical protein AV949_gp14 [Pseudoalteromonas phage H105/1]ADM26674.1 hypothetical protein [Pseudoalteromonas phage H105/1]
MNAGAGVIECQYLYLILYPMYLITNYLWLITLAMVSFLTLRCRAISLRDAITEKGLIKALSLIMRRFSGYRTLRLKALAKRLPFFACN